MRHFRYWVHVVALTLLVACAQSPSKPNASPAHGDRTAQTPHELYTRLDTAKARYEKYLQAGQQRYSTQASTEAQQTLDELRADASRCERLRDCDTERFVETLDYLLRLSVANLDASQGQSPAADSDSPTESSPSSTPSEENSPVLTQIPETARSIRLLKGRELSEIIALNDPIKAAIEEWLTHYRPHLLTTYENYHYMRYRMWPEYEKAGLPEAILFGILAKESGGKVHSVSSAGASGPLQFMYTTGLRFGLTKQEGFDQRFDPQLSARANAAYLNEQLRLFNNNLELVLAAYNGGEGRVGSLVSKTKSDSFWDPKFYTELPQETRDYVPMVLAAAWLYLHPERYRLTLPTLDTRPGHVLLKTPASLNELAICLGQDGNAHHGWFRTLRNLNPALDPRQQQSVGTRIEVPQQLEGLYQQFCAEGHWIALANELHRAERPVTPPAKTSVAKTPSTRHVARAYLVKKGDTLASIGTQARCKEPHVIAKLNGLKPPHYPIRAGQTLKIPRC